MEELRVETRQNVDSKQLTAGSAHLFTSSCGPFPPDLGHPVALLWVLRASVLVSTTFLPSQLNLLAFPLPIPQAVMFGVLVLSVKSEMYAHITTISKIPDK